MTPLRQRMSDDRQARTLAPPPQRSYQQQVSQFARHFGKEAAARCPERRGPRPHPARRRDGRHSAPARTGRAGA